MSLFFFFNDTATTEIYTLSLHDALPIFMKALGASAALINGFFAAEAAALGAVGSVLGFALGVGAATWIGRANFHAPVAPRLSVFPVVLAGSILVALLAAIVPISLLQRFQPANILRGE